MGNTYAQWNVGANKITTLSNVGIGTNNPSSQLDIGIHLSTDIYGIRLNYPALPQNSINVNRELLSLRGAGSTHFVVTRKGVSINTNDPLAQHVKLHVKGGFALIDGNQASLLFDKNSTSVYGQWGIEYDISSSLSGLNFWKPHGSTHNLQNYRMFLADNGQIGMGVDPSEFTDFNTHGYRLHVKNGIITEKVRVELIASWPDFVFDDNYKLRTLDEVEKFLTKNHHLPGIPSEKEMVSKGLDVAEMDALLLQKIEELTLYMIELKKENDDLKKSFIHSKTK